MGKQTSSSEIYQKALNWKKALLKYTHVDEPGRVHKIKGSPQGVLRYFHSFKNNPQIKLISLEKAFELKDVPKKIWRFIKKVKYLPMFLRSWRNELYYILRQTCSFNRTENK